LTRQDKTNQYPSGYKKPRVISNYGYDGIPVLSRLLDQGRRRKLARVVSCAVVGSAADCPDAKGGDGGRDGHLVGDEVGGEDVRLLVQVVQLVQELVRMTMKIHHRHGNLLRSTPFTEPFWGIVVNR